MDDLSDLDRDLLDFEQGFWRHAGARDAAIRDRFNMSRWQYQQRLFAVCEKPTALVYAPLLVNRLRRRRRSA